ncbi:MAG: hypothetical protein AAFY71_09435 [Bacteroidota bacterium]
MKKILIPLTLTLAMVFFACQQQKPTDADTAELTEAQKDSIFDKAFEVMPDSTIVVDTTRMKDQE